MLVVHEEGGNAEFCTTDREAGMSNHENVRSHSAEQIHELIGLLVANAVRHVAVVSHELVQCVSRRVSMIMLRVVVPAAGTHQLHSKVADQGHETVSMSRTGRNKRARPTKESV